MRTHLKLVFVIGWIVTLHCINSVDAFLASEESSEEDENCVVLPPVSTRTEVAGERSINITDLLNGGSSEMTNIMSTGNSWPQDAILVLGNTGSGKTTLVQILTTNLNEIHAVKTNKGELVIMGDHERIGAPSTISRTIIPELAKLETAGKPVVYFYDCPGFDDTRGPAQDLAANFFMNQILRNVARVKLLFAVTHSSVQSGHDRLDFDLLATHATRFIKDVTQFETSIGLVVTKVNSFDSRGELKDTTILRRIREFLRRYSVDVNNSFQKNNEGTDASTNSRKSAFAKILLEPKKIYISRSPEKCGPLSESAFVNRTKTKVTELYETLEYAPVGDHSNFGYTLKDRTLLSINQFAADINNGIVAHVERLTADVSQWFSNQITQTNGNTQAALQLIEKNNLLVENLSHSSTIYDTETFSNYLTSCLEQASYTVGKSFQAFMTQQGDVLSFFDEASGKPVQRAVNDWLNPVNKLQDERRSWSSEQTISLTKTVNDAITAEAEASVSKLEQWFEGQIANLKDAGSVVTFIQSSRTTIESLSTGVSQSPSQFAKHFAETVENFEIGIPNSFQTSMAEQESYLNTLDGLTGSRVFRSVNEWRAPMLRFQEKYRVWLSRSSETAIRDINAEISSTVQSTMSEFDAWFDSTKFPQDEDVEKTFSELQKSWSEYPKIELTDKSNARQLGSVLHESLPKIGFSEQEKLSQTQSLLSANQDRLSTLDLELGRSVPRESEKWWSSVITYKRKLQLYVSWYEFLNLVRVKMSSYQFQRDLRERIIDTDPISFLMKYHNLLEFHVSEQIKTIDGELARGGTWGLQHRQVLLNIISWYIEPEQHICSGDSLTVTGNVVLVSKFIDAEKLLSVCTSAKNINVYAADTVYIDRDLNGEGHEMLVSVIAPIWKVEEIQLFKLDGKHAVPTPHPNCSWTNRWRSGIAGRPGGRAGSFFGRAQRIFRASALTISVSGGNGGIGQDGCNGFRGRDGIRKEMNRDGSYNAVVFGRNRRCRPGENGQKGGNGGHGGSGGCGGMNGVVDIRQRVSDTVRVISDKGESGLGGKKGLGGPGGQAIRTRCCEEYPTILLISVANSCFLRDTFSDGEAGDDGHEGIKPSFNMCKLYADPQAVDKLSRIAEYRTMFSLKTNPLTQTFVSTLV